MHVETSDQGRLALGFGGYTLNWGVHLCGLYESDEEHDQLVHDVLHQGDLDGDLLRFVHTAPTADHFRAEYARRFPREAGHLDQGNRFLFLSARERNCPRGRFVPREALVHVSGMRERALREGLRVRTVAEMDWVLEGVPGTDLLVPYEAAADRFISGAPMVTICLYDLRRHSGATVLDVLRTHRFTLTRGVIVENPYYDPASILSRMPPGWPYAD